MNLQDFSGRTVGRASLNKLELVVVTKQSLFLEREIPKVYANLNTDPNGIMLAIRVITSSTRSIQDIIVELHSKLLRMSSLDKVHGIDAVTH